MGAGLAIRALQQPVDDDAKTVLIAMALMALDAPTNGKMPGIYWGGHDYLITVIRPGIEPETREWEAAAKSVQRRVRKLIQAGSIELLSRAVPGRHAKYRLRFQVPSWILDRREAGDNPVDDTLPFDRTGDATRPPSGSPHVPHSAQMGDAT